MSYVVRRVPKSKDQAPDQVVSSYQRLADWVRINVNAVVYSSGAVIFVLLLVFGLFWVRESRERSASEALAAAVMSLEAAGAPESLSSLSDEGNAAVASSEAAAQAALGPDLEAALENFRQVSRDHGNGPAGSEARLYEANILFRLERYQEAATVIEELAVKSPDFASETGSAHLLARTYESMKDYAKAVGTYSQLLDHAQGEYRADVMIDLARCLELSGDVDRAVTVLNDVVKEHPGTAGAAKADRKLAILGFRSGQTP